MWAAYSGTCEPCHLVLVLEARSLISRAVGRRAVYLRSLPCLCIGSVGVALSRTVPTLMCWRVVQALGASSGMSVGAGVIGDIYRLEERGFAMGIFFGVRFRIVI